MMRRPGTRSWLCALLAACVGCGLTVTGSADPHPVQPTPETGPPPVEGLITVLRADPLPQVDLTAQGTLDWTHWGQAESAPYATHRANANPRVVGDFVASGPISGQGRSEGEDGSPTFQWDDADPPLTGTSV